MIWLAKLLGYEACKEEIYQYSRINIYADKGVTPVNNGVFIKMGWTRKLYGYVHL